MKSENPNEKLLAAASAANAAALNLIEAARFPQDILDFEQTLRELVDAARLLVEAQPDRVEELHDLHRALVKWLEENPA